MSDDRIMTEHDEFVAWVESALRDAEVAFHNGDASPRAPSGHGTIR